MSQQASKTVIKPTIGRVVWFYETNEQQKISQANAALVCFVHSDKLVNLAVFSKDGSPSPYTSVTLVQEGEAAPKGMFATWMPYQIGQAAKHQGASEEKSNAS